MTTFYMSALARDVAYEVRRNEAEKARLYLRLSPVIGAFDHSEMSSEDMASYGLRRLGQTLAATSADPVSALDCYLAGLERREKVASGALDSSSHSAFLDEYLAGDKE